MGIFSFLQEKQVPYMLGRVVLTFSKGDDVWGYEYIIFIKRNDWLKFSDLKDFEACEGFDSLAEKYLSKEEIRKFVDMRKGFNKVSSTSWGEVFEPKGQISFKEYMNEFNIYDIL